MFFYSVCLLLTCLFTQQEQNNHETKAVSNAFHKVMQHIQSEQSLLSDIMEKYLLNAKVRELFSIFKVVTYQIFQKSRLEDSRNCEGICRKSGIVQPRFLENLKVSLHAASRSE